MVTSSTTGYAPCSWDKWGHDKTASPADWEDVKEYIEAISQWAEWRKKYPKAFEILDGRGRGVYYKEPERKMGRPPKEVNKPTGATPLIPDGIQYTLQPNGVEVTMIDNYLWPKETIDAIQDGTFKDYNYRGPRTIWEIWEAHNSFSLT